jgi:putative peptidoglycan lipid II flippase
MAAGTLIARITGFGKVLALAWVLGSGRLADAFNLANNLPNSVYDLLLGGVLSATLIPVFVDELRRENRHESTRAISAVVTTIVALLAVMTVIFWFITPAIIDLLVVNAQGSGVGQERHTAIQLLHLFVPQLPLLGAIAVTTALLNARRRFAAPAFSPILANVVTIAAVIATKYVAHRVSLNDFQTDTTAVVVLGLGTTAGYLAQFLAQVPSVFRAGIRLRPVWNPGHPAVRTVLRLSVWTFGAVVTNQISFYVIQLLADTRKGSVTSFNYAYQFFQLPYAIFAVSIASVIAPDLAQKWSNGMRRAFRARMGSGIRLTLAILFPAGVGYAIVAQPLLRLALRHGSFTVAQTQLTGDLVAIFAIGLPGFSVYLLLMRAYQSMKDTRSMFWCYCVENGLTVAVGAGLYPVWGVRGLVVGWIGSYSVVAVIAFAHLRARVGGLQGPAVLVTGVPVVIATAAMAGVLEGLDHVLPTSDQLGLLAARVAVLLVAGTVVYITVALWLGVAEVRQVLRRGATSPR